MPRGSFGSLPICQHWRSSLVRRDTAWLNGYNQHDPYAWSQLWTVLKGTLKVEFVGIYDRDVERREKYATEFGIKSFSTVDDLLEEVNAVSICSENFLHAKYTLQAARAGKHVLCEKPLATTLADAQATVDFCEEQGVMLQTAFPYPPFHTSGRSKRDY